MSIRIFFSNKILISSDGLRFEHDAVGSDGCWSSNFCFFFGGSAFVSAFRFNCFGTITAATVKLSIFRVNNPKMPFSMAFVTNSSAKAMAGSHSFPFCQISSILIMQIASIVNEVDIFLRSVLTDVVTRNYKFYFWKVTTKSMAINIHRLCCQSSKVKFQSLKSDNISSKTDYYNRIHLKKRGWIVAGHGLCRKDDEEHNQNSQHWTTILRKIINFNNSWNAAISSPSNTKFWQWCKDRWSSSGHWNFDLRFFCSFQSPAFGVVRFTQFFLVLIKQGVLAEFKSIRWKYSSHHHKHDSNASDWRCQPRWSATSQTGRSTCS